MESHYLNHINQGQSETVAFISSESEIDLLLETISALSNTNGGLIFIGVNIKGKIVGVNPYGIKSKLTDIITKSFSGILSFNIDTCYQKHLCFCVMKISESINKPLFYSKDLKKISFFRYGVYNVKVSNILNQIWNAQKKRISIHLNDDNSDRLSKNEFSILSKTPHENPISFSKLHSTVNMPIKMFEESLVHLVLLEKLTYVLNKENITFIKRK